MKEITNEILIIKEEILSQFREVTDETKEFLTEMKESWFWYDRNHRKADKKRKGFKYDGSAKYLNKSEIDMYTHNFIRDLQNKNYRWLVEMSYNTLCNRQLKKWAKSEKRNRLLDALYSCATQKPTKNAVGVLARMYNFNFKEVWNNALVKDWGELKNA